VGRSAAHDEPLAVYQPAAPRSLRLRTGSQSWPKRMMTTRSSSLRIAWSTAYPESRCGNMYDMAAV
jgi:hypothetical protein